MNEMQEGPPVEGGRRWKVVYTIIERRGDRNFWLRVGIAFENKDGSWNIRLDAMPVNGQLHMRDPEPYEQRDGSSNGNGIGGRRELRRAPSSVGAQGVL